MEIIILLFFVPRMRFQRAFLLKEFDHISFVLCQDPLICHSVLASSDPSPAGPVEGSMDKVLLVSPDVP